GARGDAALGPYVVTLVATAPIDGQPRTQAVSVKDPVSASLSGLPYPPLGLNHRVALAVKEKAPFALAVHMEPAQAVPGIATQVTVRANRAAGFAEEIVLGPPAGLPATVTVPKITKIAKDKNEANFQLDVSPKTPFGEYLVFVVGKSKIKD